MTSPRDIETQLRRLSPAKPASELRQKLLAQFEFVTPTRIHLLDRVWFSRGIRLAAVLTLILATTLSIFENRNLEQRVASISGSTREEARHLDPGATSEVELAISEYDRSRWHRASQRGSLQTKTYQQQLATLMEL